MQTRECMFRNNIMLTNTIFKHKMAHRTIWLGPERTNERKDENGDIRRNPYRNQIDCVMMRKCHRKFVSDSRSHNGFKTSTEICFKHKMSHRTTSQGPERTNECKNKN